MNSQADSIFALSTGWLKSAIHLHRISGDNVFDLLSPFVFFPHAVKNCDLKEMALSLQGRPVAFYAFLYDDKSEMLDDVILTLFPCPKSYTGENTIEISLHGNPLLSAKLHSLLRSLGMRDALPGEFTQRAVLNGKLDLAQAEGINQLIHTETLGGIELARKTVLGVLSKETIEIREELISILAYLEAHIDFAPDEVGDYEPNTLLPKLSIVLGRLEDLFSSYSSGIKMRDGVRLVLAGKPNAGKSSLYNSLLRFDRAIVTHIPGTTRDVLEDRLVIQNKDFILNDTAGIRLTQDEVEKIGVERSLKSIETADIIGLVIDIHQCELNCMQNFILSEMYTFLQHSPIQSTQKLLIILSKNDLLSADLRSSFKDLIKKLQQSISEQELAFTCEVVAVSLTENSELCELLVRAHVKLTENTAKKDSPILISSRQKDKVTIAIQLLNEAVTLIQHKDYPEKIASLINNAKSSVEEIVGEILLDNVYEKIFSTFCVGK